MIEDTARSLNWHSRALTQGGTDLNLAMRPGDRVLVPESRAPSAQTLFFIIQSLIQAAVVITTLSTQN